MIDGFKKFIARGNMIDMAVGVVMGGAVTTVVNAIVNNVINPLIAMIFGKPNMDGLLAITFNGATISFGAVLGALLNFLIIAVAVYFGVLVPINKIRDMSEALLVKARIKEAGATESGESFGTGETGKTVDGGKPGESGKFVNDGKPGESGSDGKLGEFGEPENGGSDGAPASSATSSADAQVIALLTEIRDELAKGRARDRS